MSLATKEVVFDELQVRVERERLVVNVAFLGIRADDHGRHAHAISVAVHGRRNDVVVEAAQSSHARKMAELSRSGLCITALMSCVTYVWPSLTMPAVFAILAVRDDPRNGGQRTLLSGIEEFWYFCTLPELLIVLDRLEAGQRVPDSGRGGRLRAGRQNIASSAQSGSAPSST